MTSRRVNVFILIIAVIFCLGAAGIQLLDIETAVLDQDYAKAENMAQQFLALKDIDKNKRNQAMYFLGLSQLRLGYYQKCRETLYGLISNYPDNNLRDRAYLSIIDSHYLEGQYEEGLQAANELYSNSPNSPFLSTIYLKLARGNIKAARWRAAKRFLDEIIRRFPDSFEAHLAQQLENEERYFAVQVGAFLDIRRAKRLANELKEKGEYAYIVETTDRKGRIFYRVRVGQFAALDDAKKLKKKLSRSGYPTRIYP